jgi:hypothetical protein
MKQKTLNSILRERESVKSAGPQFPSLLHSKVNKRRRTKTQTDKKMSQTSLPSRLVSTPFTPSSSLLGNTKRSTQQHSEQVLRRSDVGGKRDHHLHDSLFAFHTHTQAPSINQSNQEKVSKSLLQLAFLSLFSKNLLRHAQIPLQVYVRETLECVLLY